MRFTVADNGSEAATGRPTQGWPRFVHHRLHGVVARFDNRRQQRAWEQDTCPYHPDDYTIEDWQ